MDYPTKRAQWKTRKVSNGNIRYSIVAIEPQPGEILWSGVTWDNPRAQQVINDLCDEQEKYLASLGWIIQSES